MQRHRPASEAEVVEIVTEAFARRAPLAIEGFGSKSALGPPVEAQAVLAMDGLAAVELYEPDELVIRTGAGASLASVQALLAQNGQRLAFAPPDWRRLLGSPAPAQSMAGIAATNLSGSARLTVGAARDHLIGFTAVNGAGERFKSGGRVVKNVTGYDLSKLMAGAFGTLGVLTSVTFRVTPLPEHETTLAVAGVDALVATTLFAAALGGPDEIAACAWLPAGPAARLGLSGPVALLRLEGLAASIRVRLEGLRARIDHPADRIEGADSAALWTALGDAAPLTEPMDRALWRVSAPPMEAADLLATAPEAAVLLDWAGGLVWLAMPEEGDAGAARIRAHLAQCGGHATLVRAGAALRERVPAIQPRPAALAALEARVRESFDPAGILNPGRTGALA